MPIRVPIGAEETFMGVVDLVSMKALVWEGDEMGRHYDTREIPAE